MTLRSRPRRRCRPRPCSRPAARPSRARHTRRPRRRFRFMQETWYHSCASLCSSSSTPIALTSSNPLLHHSENRLCACSPHLRHRSPPKAHSHSSSPIRSSRLARHAESPQSSAPSTQLPKHSWMTSMKSLPACSWTLQVFFHFHYNHLTIFLLDPVSRFLEDEFLHLYLLRFIFARIFLLSIKSNKKAFLQPHSHHSQVFSFFFFLCFQSAAPSSSPSLPASLFTNADLCSLVVSLSKALGLDSFINA